MSPRLAVHSDRYPLGSLGLQESVREEWAFVPSEGDEPGRVFDLEAARRGCPAAVDSLGRAAWIASDSRSPAA